ncbi:hypothetical protein [uncultured Winogradskyella sp.]|uniref:hypothetical protein n=1 Tax=uncultured Winogradskyella sp. TaxID=395353 RepID=UPI002620B5AF|nr:hypothetical protein [uncultured Winogradskyella sp.]
MKNFGLLILGIILGALIMYFYCCKDSGITDPQPPDIEEPYGLISPEEARALDKAYSIKHRIINDSLFKKSTTGGDNRSSWWSIEDIQNYINYAENQAGELGYTMDGLRLYLGAYPSSKTENGLTTMFFVPTGIKNTSEGSILPMPQGGSSDIQNANALNKGSQGDPPGANYPQ